MRVLHFIPVYKPAWCYGGPVRSVSQLCEELVKQGINVTVVTTNANGNEFLDIPTNLPVDVDGVRVFYFKKNQMPWGIDSFELRRNIKNLISKFDLMHMSGVWQPLSIPVTRAAAKAGIPYISSLRGAFGTWLWHNRHLKHHIYWTFFEKGILERACALHATCEAEKKEILSVVADLHKNFIMIPNGIYLEDYSRRPDLAEKFRTRMGLDSHRKIMLSFGRIHPKKGLDLFIRSIGDILQKAKDWVYMIIGPDEHGHKEEIISLVNQMGLSEKVLFCGMVSGEMRQGAYSASDIFVLTSHNENFGMSVVEAMASSVPVLISDQVGISREIATAGAGMVTQLDENTIRQSLASLIKNDDLRNNYSRKGLHFVRQKYDISVVARKMIEAYEDILTSRKSPECN